MALDAGVAPLPPVGRILLFRPPADVDLGLLPPDRCTAVTGDRPGLDALAARGLDASHDVPDGQAGLAVVFLPRAKALARDLVARAAAAVRDGATILIDGAKSDGVEAMLRAVRAAAPVGDVVSKAHGKVFAATATPALRGWAVPPRDVGGFVTAPGTFSADGVDPGSALLADALPALSGAVCDLGAGWGYLSRAVLRSDVVRALDVVEAERAALDCSRLNVRDPRAAFHWADATRWAGGPYDAVVTNPPFHAGRAADPSLGRAFVATAARVLRPSGRLHLVANRHLPYEAALGAAFAEVAVRRDEKGYKVIEATRPITVGGRRR